jgi:hypothetical protein
MRRFSRVGTKEAFVHGGAFAGEDQAQTSDFSGGPVASSHCLPAAARLYKKGGETTGGRRPFALLIPVVKGTPAMQARPQTKKRRKSRFKRCPKCNKQVRLHQVRCRTCHQKLKLK